MCVFVCEEERCKKRVFVCLHTYTHRPLSVVILCTVISFIFLFDCCPPVF